MWPKTVVIAGNIANYAYELALILRSNNIDAYVLSDGLTHVMSQPEWTYSESYLPDISDCFDEWNSEALVSLSDPTRCPSWYIKGDNIYYSLLVFAVSRKFKLNPNICVHIVNVSGKSISLLRLCFLVIRRIFSAALRVLSVSVKQMRKLVKRIRIKTQLYRSNLYEFSKKHANQASTFLAGIKPTRKDRIHSRISTSSDDFLGVPSGFAVYVLNTTKNVLSSIKYYPSTIFSRCKQLGLSKKIFILNWFSKHRFPPINLLLKNDFRKQLLRYLYRDIQLQNIVFIGTTITSEYFRDIGITDYSNLCLGTIRGLPFEKSALGILTRTIYQSCKKALLTNYDCGPQAKLLWPNEPSKYFFLLHPYKVRNITIQQKDQAFDQLNKQYGIVRGRPYFLCPARHHWTTGNASELKGNDIMIKGIARFISKLSSCDKNKPIFILNRWGVDIEASKKLIASLCIQNNIIWIPPLPKVLYLTLISESCGVIDQFNAKTFGGVALDTISSGSVLITSIDESCLKLKFPELPYFLSPKSPNQLDEKLEEAYYMNANDKANIKRIQKRWFELYHSESQQLNELKQVFPQLA